MTMVGDTQRKGETKPELWKSALWAFANPGRGDFDDVEVPARSSMRSVKSKNLPTKTLL